MYETTAAADGLRVPILINALHSPMDAGHVAAIVSEHLMDSLQHERVATFDVDTLVDFRQHRPQMLFENVTSVFQVVQIVITALLGIFAVAAGLEGYILRTMHWPLRVLAVIGGLTLLIPGTVSDLIGLVIVAGIIALQIVQNKKAARETA